MVGFFIYVFIYLCFFKCSTDFLKSGPWLEYLLFLLVLIIDNVCLILFNSGVSRNRKALIVFFKEVKDVKFIQEFRLGRVCSTVK